jgi:hypothetical protein
MVVMARCTECGYDWDSTPSQVVARIDGIGAASRAALAGLLSGSDPDATLRARPAAGVWSPLEYLAHLRDAVEFYAARIEAVLTSDHPRMAAADFSAMAEDRRYNDEPDPLAVVNQLGRRADAVARRLASLRPTEWDRVGIGSEGGERSVLVLGRRLAHESNHHLMDLDRQRRAVGGDEGPGL